MAVTKRISDMTLQEEAEAVLLAVEKYREELKRTASISTRGL
jgi:hypothetical protein